ncbi:YceI family protein [Croceitalea sp. MTPC9]|uniref:YceI family protein n=1 Tax=unclassified Croceitalea TaxID=2632280 RepID=UPI002B3B3311|nr:YceI family protein [Croceitalea sp. MTPC6]GMN15691.1 YceI family protein [Croceitalea sp. MTPC9]
MKRLTLFLSLVTLFSLHNSVNSQTTISKAKISFEFVSKDVKGTIEGFESSSKIDFDNPENSFFSGSVAVKTLDTNNGLRNWSLKSGKYFDEDDFPRIEFESSAVNPKDDGYLVKGNLTLKGTTKPITIVFAKQGNQLKGTTSIYCSDYGIKIKKKREDNLVRITLLFDIK